MPPLACVTSCWGRGPSSQGLPHSYSSLAALSSSLPLRAEYSTAKFRSALLSMPPGSCLKSVKEQQLSLVEAGARGPGAMLLFMQTMRPLQLLQLFTVQEAA